MFDFSKLSKKRQPITRLFNAYFYDSLCVCHSSVMTSVEKHAHKYWLLAHLKKETRLKLVSFTESTFVSTYTLLEWNWLLFQHHSQRTFSLHTRKVYTQSPHPPK